MYLGHHKLCHLPLCCVVLCLVLHLGGRCLVLHLGHHKLCHLPLCCVLFGVTFRWEVFGFVFRCQ